MGDERTMPRTRRYLGLVAVVTAISVLLSGLALAGLVPAALSATAAARELGGHAGPLGGLLARPPTRSVIRAADGSVLAVLHGDQDRVVVPLAAVPVTVRNAVLAAEDARFYAHGALDVRGIARAAVVDLTSHRLREGGSSIAQQYVKNVVTGDRRSLGRKLAEAVDAAELERSATKDQILAAYLNQVYFGEGVYGIATAARHYFATPVGGCPWPRRPPWRARSLARSGSGPPPAGPPWPAATWSSSTWRRSPSPARPGSRRPSGSRCGRASGPSRAASPTWSTP